MERFHPIELSLLSGNELIGQTQIPLHKIIKPLQQKSGMEKLFDSLNEEYQLRLSPLSRNDKTRSFQDDDELQPTVHIKIELTRETRIHEQKSNNPKQHRQRSNSVNNEHNSSTTTADNDHG